MDSPLIVLHLFGDVPIGVMRITPEMRLTDHALVVGDEMIGVTVYPRRAGIDPETGLLRYGPGQFTKPTMSRVVQT